ncbi:MAG: RDD family protein [Myxococcota bacterium]
MSVARLEIVGPEGVPLGFPAASLAERGAAFCFDLFVIGCGLVALSLLLVAAAGTGIGLPLVLIGFFALRHFYFALFELLWRGATPGKRLLKIRVISRDGLGLTPEAVFARNLVRDVEMFVPLVVLSAPETVLGPAPWWLRMLMGLWALVMAVLPVLTKEGVRVGDLVGGTRVVRVPSAELRADAADRVSLAPHEAAAAFTDAQLAHYGERELETLADLLRRFEEDRAELHDLHVVATTIAAKIGYGGDLPTQDPPRFLRSFYKHQRAALERQLLFGKRKASKLDR